MDIDITWKDPSKAQEAALAHVMVTCKQFMRSRSACNAGLTEFMLAEMMCMAESSLWYAQARSWSEGKYPAKGADDVFRMAGTAIVKLVDLGYSKGKWWDASQVWDDPLRIALHLTSIVEAVRLLREIRPKSLAVYSQGFEVLPYLMLPRLKVGPAMKALMSSDGAKMVFAKILAQHDEGARKALDEARKRAKKTAAETYAPVECRHPGCKRLLPPRSGIRPREGHHKNYRNTDACCRGHANYFCTKCNRPHSYASKVGQKHFPEHYGKDWDGTGMDGEKWKLK